MQRFLFPVVSILQNSSTINKVKYGMALAKRQRLDGKIWATRQRLDGSFGLKNRIYFEDYILCHPIH